MDKSDMKERFGKRLYNLRKNKGVAVNVAAELCGTTLHAWQNYEAGKTFQQVGTLLYIAEYFEVTTDYLLCLTDKKGRSR